MTAMPTTTRYGEFELARLALENLLRSLEERECFRAASYTAGMLRDLDRARSAFDDDDDHVL
jgi:hypothetical protein